MNVSFGNQLSAPSYQLSAGHFILFNFGAVSSVRSQPEACQAGNRLEAES
jgi:hypothetical protein